MSLVDFPASRFGSISQAPTPPWKTDDEALIYAKDPKAFLLKATKAWSKDLTLLDNQILSVTYYTPSVRIMANGKPFFITDKTADEAKYQGKVGLIVALGPRAFVDDERRKFYGQTVAVGDWVFYRTYNSPEISINGTHCRMLTDDAGSILGKIAHPDLVY